MRQLISVYYVVDEKLLPPGIFDGICFQNEQLCCLDESH